MTRDELLNLFRRSGALLEGHFRLTSGLHSSGYLQCALVLQHPDQADALGRAIARAHARPRRDGRALPGARRRRHRPGSGRALGVRAIFAERQDGALDAPARLHARGHRSRARHRRRADDRRLDARDDTGGQGGRRAGRRRRIDGRPERGAPRDSTCRSRALLDIALPTYEPGACPLCAQGLAVVKPGSRPVVA